GSGRGSGGRELAPLPRAPRLPAAPAPRRRELRKVAQDHGLTLIGLHWLLARTEGLRLTSADPAVRRRTADYLAELGRCCADLGGDILVFGSPAQRRIPAGTSREQATDWAVDTFRQSAPALEDARVRLCLAPLPPPAPDSPNTADEGPRRTEGVGSPGFCRPRDVRAMSPDPLPATEVIRRHAARLGHFHANDPNRRGPGFGATDFVPIFRALREV